MYKGDDDTGDQYHDSGADDKGDDDGEGEGGADKLVDERNGFGDEEDEEEGVHEHDY